MNARNLAGEAAPAPDAAASGSQPGVSPVTLDSYDVFQRIGALTRSLHDTLRELGYATDVERAVGALPDARARLDYVARLTGEAAGRVLDSAERGKNHLESILQATAALQEKWQQPREPASCGPEIEALGRETNRQFAETIARCRKVDEEFTDIILAQDFHDLTGQVIQRITRIAQSLEDQLVRLLLDATPPALREESVALAGPVINASEARDDVVTSQSQVDSLLESLGF